MHPELFRFPDLLPFLGGHAVHTYGVTAASGFLAAFFFARWQSIKTRQDPEATADYVFYGIIFGVIGARLLYVIISWGDHFAAHPADIIRIDKGGLVWYGGPLFTAPALWYVIYRRKDSIMAFSDVIMPAATLALGIGRLGCLAAGCCYGKPAHVPWAITYPEGSTPYYAYLGEALHPAPLYELSACLLIVGIGVWYNQRKKIHGETFYLTLILYAFARSVIEIFRGDKVRGFAIGDWLSTSQFISLLVAIGGIATWIYFRKHPTPTMALDYYGPSGPPRESGSNAQGEAHAKA